MSLCWFAQASAAGASPDLAAIAATIAAVPGVTEALLHSPAATHDPYLNDGAPPRLAIQLYFPDIETLEAALTADGPLKSLPSLAGDDLIQQAMLVRRFPVPDPTFRGRDACTYLVAYEGSAEDLPAWLSHYIAHHAAIMARFPNVRRVEIYSRLDWCDSLPWARADHMQRNKVVFDDQEGLTAALNSPVRHEMRADFGNFPAFTGPVTHFPMTTRVVV